MNQPKKCTAISALLVLLALSVSPLVHAAPAVGTVTHLSGPLLATKTDGTIRVLGILSAVESGDTLSTQKNGYAQIEFTDGSQFILQPATALSVDAFAYDAAKPELDHADFSLVRGGVRANPGAIGERSKDRVILNTPLAKIDLQNATAVVRYVVPDAEALAAAQAFLFASTAALDTAWQTTRSDTQPVNAIRPLMLAQLPPRAPSLAPGLYVQVIDGLINLSNKGGAQSFAAGQFGYTANFIQPPVVVPKNPGIQFTPPPAFSAPTPKTSSSAPAKSSQVDCEVR